MNTGTGIAIIGFWLPVMAAMLAPEVTNNGLRRANIIAGTLTLCATAFDFYLSSTRP